MVDYNISLYKICLLPSSYADAQKLTLLLQTVLSTHFIISIFFRMIFERSSLNLLDFLVH